jgi:hypothetical protein
MIELNSKTQQDFLNREWVQRLLDAGVDMSDAKYCIMKDKLQDHYYIALDKDIKGEYTEILCMWDRIMPTYTVSELLYKLHEWIYPTIDGKEYNGGLTMMKDAPFYMFYYKLRHDNGYLPDDINEDYIYAESEYPIESLAMILIQCHKKDIGIKVKDTGDISDK